MFSAIGRYFKALGYLLTGRIDQARKTLNMDPNVMRAQYEEIIKDKKNRIQEFMKAVSGIISMQEKKKASLTSLSQEINHLEELKTGALAKAKARVNELAGKSEEEIKKDEAYITCSSAYNDFSSTLAEKQKRAIELENDIKSYQEKINEHKVQMEQLKRELENLKTESYDAVADILSAQEEKNLADMLSGISQDTTTQTLQELRDMRSEAKAGARVAQELAGTDTKVQEAQFLDYARKSKSADEFDQLVGLAKEKDTPKEEASEPEKEAEKSGLPE